MERLRNAVILQQQDATTTYDKEEKFQLEENIWFAFYKRTCRNKECWCQYAKLL